VQKKTPWWKDVLDTGSARGPRPESWQKVLLGHEGEGEKKENLGKFDQKSEPEQNTASTVTRLQENARPFDT